MEKYVYIDNKRVLLRNGRRVFITQPSDLDVLKNKLIDVKRGRRELEALALTFANK